LLYRLDEVCGWSVAFSPDGKWLATGGMRVAGHDDLSVRLWDTHTQQCVQALHGHTEETYAVAFHPDGRRLASGSGDRTIRLWDIQTGTCLAILQGQKGEVSALRFSPDGRLLASGGRTGTLHLWDVSSGQCVRVLQGGGFFDFRADGRLLAYGMVHTVGDRIHLYDVQTGEVVQTLRGERPYERMNISGATGLTDAERATLRALGAVEDQV
jgi:WD40 repeat protein